jgi:thiol-disulfide isomerase/thioredoxin
MQKLAFACGLVAALSAPLNAQKLAVGADAPPLQIEKWLKGDAVAAFAPGKVYVVEFWATWCGPCIASMPHLTELQAEWKDKGVTIIGVTSEDPNNSLDKAAAMVETKAEGMGYTVAWDQGRKTNEAYMKASGQNGIPCSFLVDAKGKLAYIGHPMMLDIPLREVVAGTWDPVKGKEKVDAAMKQLRALTQDIKADTPEGNAKIDAFVAEYPMFAAQIANTRFTLLLQAGKLDKAFATGAKIVEASIQKKDTNGLNEVAWAIVDPEAKLEKRDLDLAMKAAAKAVELTKAKDANILDTLARVWFWKKDYSKALELQTKAVSLESGRDDLKKSLAEYEQLLKDGKKDGQ